MISRRLEQEPDDLRIAQTQQLEAALWMQRLAPLPAHLRVRVEAMRQERTTGTRASDDDRWPTISRQIVLNLRHTGPRRP